MIPIRKSQKLGIFLFNNIMDKAQEQAVKTFGSSPNQMNSQKVSWSVTPAKAGVQNILK
jgi:hypothetical protein